MRDTTEDHAAALIDATEGYILDSSSGFSRAGGLAGIRQLAEAVIAERDRACEAVDSMFASASSMGAQRDALLAYARMVTAFALTEDAASGPAIAKMQEVAGVAELMARGDEE